MFISLIAIYIVLPMVAHGQPDFTALIYDKFGFTENAAQFLSNDNLTKLSDQVLNGHLYNTQATTCENSSCTTNSCYSPLASHDGSYISTSNFPSACSRILYSLTQDCIKAEAHHREEETTHAVKPSPSAVWGYGFLFVTLINLCSLAGIFVLPLMKKEFYSTLLMFLIALAVGSLAANGILVLIPEAFEIVEMEGYTWKACSIVGGIYLFFVTERILKIITDYYMEKKHEKGAHGHSHIVPSIPTQTFTDIDRDIDPPGSRCNKLEDPKQDSQLGNGDAKQNGHGHAKISDEGVSETKKPIATVAWMIIFGDAFHNFIDGLSIGAAFSDSTLLGVSICIAVLCEELPHELGLSKKKALLFNFLSACTCYLGLVFGITLSEVAHATPWILGVAGGMFLYISLADMMPEMNRAAEEHKDKPLRVFLIQNFGFLSGFGVILLVSYFGAQIELS